MIIRLLPMHAAAKSSVSRAVGYITDSQGKQERVAAVFTSNLLSQHPKDAVFQMAATQALNKKARGDRTLHLVIAFNAGDEKKLDLQKVKDIEAKVAEALGYKDHQRVAALHEDTDYLHLHVVINKIHPKTHKMCEHWKAFDKAAKIAEAIEAEYGLLPANHESAKTASAASAQDMERQANQESLAGFIKRELSAEISSVENWGDLHQLVREHGLRLQQRGAGLVFVDEDSGVAVKASTVDKAFSKSRLEKKLGEFREPDEMPNGLPSPALSDAEAGETEKPASENSAQGTPRYETEDAARQPLKAALKAELRVKFSTAENWKDFQELLKGMNVSLCLRGNGFVFVGSNGETVKASDIGREFSKANLEKRFGAFEAVQASSKSGADKHAEPRQTIQGGKRYRKRPLTVGEERALLVEYRTARIEAQTERDTAFQQLKNEGETRRAAIKAEAQAKKLVIRQTFRDPQAKRMLVEMVNESMRLDLKAVSNDLKAKREAAYLKCKKQTWLDFLHRKAMQGDPRAAALLRARKGGAPPQPGDFIVRVEQMVRIVMSGPMPFDSATKRGTFIYSDGDQAIRDDGRRMSVSDVFDRDLVRKALIMARERYGQQVDVTGSVQFKAMAILAAVEGDMDIRFADAAMESRRAALMDQKHGRPSQLGTELERGARILHAEHEHAKRIGLERVIRRGIVRTSGADEDARRKADDAAELCKEGELSESEERDRAIRRLFYEQIDRDIQRHRRKLSRQRGADIAAGGRTAEGAGAAALSALPGGELGESRSIAGQHQYRVYLREQSGHAGQGHVRSRFAGRDHDDYRLQRLPPGDCSGAGFKLASPNYVLKTTGEKACQLYLGERMQKQAQGISMENHYRARPSGKDQMVFRGLRHVGSETLVLISRPGEEAVGVCPIEETAAKEEDLKFLRRGTVFAPMSAKSVPQALRNQRKMDMAKKIKKNGKKTFSR